MFMGIIMLILLMSINNLLPGLFVLIGTKKIAQIEDSGYWKSYLIAFAGSIITIVLLLIISSIVFSGLSNSSTEMMMNILNLFSSLGWFGYYMMMPLTIFILMGASHTVVAKYLLKTDWLRAFLSIVIIPVIWIILYLITYLISNSLMNSMANNMMY